MSPHTHQQRHALITGSTSGTGLACAIAMAKTGMAVTVHGRRPNAIQTALDQVKAASPKPETISTLDLDLSDLKATGQACAELRQKLPRLDYLILNAGIMAPRQARSGPDGQELQFTINVLAHWILTAKLLPLMRQTGHCRIVSVSSIRHHEAPPRNVTPWNPNIYDGRKQYATTKAWNLAFALWLDNALAPDPATIRSTAAHPGWSATALQRRGPYMDKPNWEARLNAFMTRIIAQPASWGAKPILAAALSPIGHSDTYLGPTGPAEIWSLPLKPVRRAKISPWARSADNQCLVASKCEELTQTKMPID